MKQWSFTSSKKMKFLGEERATYRLSLSNSKLKNKLGQEVKLKLELALGREVLHGLLSYYYISTKSKT